MNGDIWFRPITNERHYNRTKRHVRHSALKRWIDEPEVRSAWWKSEISGRLRTIAVTLIDIRTDTDRRVERQQALAAERGERGHEFKFVAVIHSHAERIRQWKIDRCDVLYDPKTKKDKPDFDLAHANLVFVINPPEGVLSVIDELIDRLAVTPEDQLHHMPSADCKAPRGYRLRCTFQHLSNWLRH